MDKITDIEQLRKEVTRLTTLKENQEIALKVQWAGLKERYRPVNILKRSFSAAFGPKRDPDLFSDSAGFGISFLLDKILLKNKSWLVRSVASYVSGNLASKALDGVGGKVVDFVKGWFGKRKRNKEDDQPWGI